MRLTIKTRLRDFIITTDDWVFAVADYTHQNGVRCILRYVPDKEGERLKNGVRYHKLDFDDSFTFMKKHRPSWVKDVHIVPFDQVKQVLNPVRRIPDLIRTSPEVAVIVQVLLNGGIPLSQIGITGSHLPGLTNETSDIDLIVYGKHWFKARDLIAKAKKTGGTICEINDEMWHRIYNKRIPATTFEEFILHEKRKGNRGMVNETYFDLLYVRDWKDIKPLLPGVDIKHQKIEAMVTNADYAFDAPSIYKIDHPEIKYVLSYTHTYAGQAKRGEHIEAEGMVEQIGNIKRLVVGTSREPKNEWIRSLTLIKNSTTLRSSTTK